MALQKSKQTHPQYNISGQLNFIQAAVVPVPAAAWLFATGCIGLLGVARRR